MHAATEDETALYKVVISEEGQYAIWPGYKPNAPGWTDEGKTGSQSECLAYIQEAWTDMRPLSLRRMMANQPQ